MTNFSRMDTYFPISAASRTFSLLFASGHTRLFLLGTTSFLPLKYPTHYSPTRLETCPNIDFSKLVRVFRHISVDGLATAGGCEITLACDLVVATTRSSFGLAEVKRNLIAAAGGLFRLPRAIGQAAAMEAILTGEPLSAKRAYELGLVSRLVEPGKAMEEARKLAAQITENAPLAIYASREVVLAAAYQTDDQLKELTGKRMAEVMSSPDLKEGLQAFIEKRKPKWTGKLRSEVEQTRMMKELGVGKSEERANEVDEMVAEAEGALQVAG